MEPTELDLEALRSEYNFKEPLFQRLIDETAFVLDEELPRAGIIAFDVKKRVKDFDSFWKKLIRYEISDNFFDRIDDLAGVRVVCLYRSDLEKVESVVRESFSVASAKIRTRGNPSHEFGYVSDDFIIRLKDELHGPRYDDIKSLKCEIQARTILMDAWAAVSHHLDYKQDHDIPTNLKRDFYALVGLFHIADSEFEVLRRAREDSIDRLAGISPAGEFDLNIELNLDTLNAYLLWRFPDRRRAPSDEVSRFIAHLTASGFTSFQKIDSAFMRYNSVLREHEKQNPPFSVDRKYSSLGALRTLLCIASEKFCKITGRSDEIFEEYRSKA